MSIRRATGMVTGLFAALIVLGASSIAVGAQDAPDTFLALLMRGSVQVVLSVCLVAVTAALCVTGKLLIVAYKERITALERAVELAAQTSQAQTTLAGSIDRLRSHCESRALRGPT